MEDKFVLEDSEYFQLEAHEWKKKEFEYERKLLLLQKEVTKRDISILQFNAENLRKRVIELDEQASQLTIKIENVDVAKNKVVDTISERLELDSSDWGYNPETLEIIK